MSDLCGLALHHWESVLETHSRTCRCGVFELENFLPYNGLDEVLHSNAAHKLALTKA